MPWRVKRRQLRRSGTSIAGGGRRTQGQGGLGGSEGCQIHWKISWASKAQKRHGHQGGAERTQGGKSREGSGVKGSGASAASRGERGRGGMGAGGESGWRRPWRIRRWSRDRTVSSSTLLSCLLLNRSPPPLPSPCPPPLSSSPLFLLSSHPPLLLPSPPPSSASPSMSSPRGGFCPIDPFSPSKASDVLLPRQGLRHPESSPSPRDGFCSFAPFDPGGPRKRGLPRRLGEGWGGNPGWRRHWRVKSGSKGQERRRRRSVGSKPQWGAEKCTSSSYLSRAEGLP